MRRDVLEVESMEDGPVGTSNRCVPFRVPRHFQRPSREGAILRLIVACMHVRDERFAKL